MMSARARARVSDETFMMERRRARYVAHTEYLLINDVPYVHVHVSLPLICAQSFLLRGCVKESFASIAHTGDTCESGNAWLARRIRRKIFSGPLIPRAIYRAHITFYFSVSK